MKNRTDAYNSIYLPYVEKLLGGKVLQNILVTGADGGGIGNEVQRHKNLNYQHMFHYENKLDYDAHKIDNKEIEDFIIIQLFKIIFFHQKNQ